MPEIFLSIQVSLDGYIDEVRLLVYPVLLGAGPPLFSGQRSRLRLVECRPFPMSGAVQLRYRSVR
jgi:hypothetical protein